MDTEEVQYPGARSPPDPRSPATVERSITAAGETHPPPPSIGNPRREPMQGSKRKADHLADNLATHEQTHREIMRALEHEERKLNERRKRAGGNTTKLKKIIQEGFELNALKQFNDVRIGLHRKKVKNPNLKLCPSLRASTTIARQFGKSNYFARKLREKSTHLYRVGELQTSKQGKGGAHLSLLSEPRVVTAIQTWVKGVIPVEKGGYNGRVQHFVFKTRIR